MLPQNMPLCCADYFEQRALGEQQMQAEVFPETPYLPKDGYSKKKYSIIVNLLSGNLINMGRLTPITGEETGHHAKTDNHLFS